MQYENTKELKRAMGLVALLDWAFILIFTGIALALQEDHLFFSYIASLGSIFLFFKVITVYPFESYGGKRVLQWKKSIYAVCAAASVFVIILSN